MPKESTIKKDDIVNAAFEIVRTEGFAALSARNIAKKIGCSTQPIYWIYQSMEVLRKDVICVIAAFLKDRIVTYKQTGKPFLDMGLGYIWMAYSEPVLFRIVYIENIRQIKLADIVPNEAVFKAMTNDEEVQQIPAEKYRSMAVQAMVFAHGLASLVSSGMLDYDADKIADILGTMFD